MSPRQQFVLRASLAFIHDLAAAALAWAVAFWLRFNLDIPPLYSDLLHFQSDIYS